MEKAGQTEGSAVRDALASLTAADGTAVSPDKYEDAVTAVKAGKKILYQGAAGPLVLDAAGDPTSALYDIWQVKDGAVTAVEKGVSP